MKVKLFDYEDESDLELAINSFLDSGTYDIIDIRYCVSSSIYGEEQIFCFSAMVVYTQ